MAKSINKSAIISQLADQLGSFRLACIMMVLSQALWVLSFIYPNEQNFSLFETGLIRGIATTIANYIICVLYSYRVDFQSSRFLLKQLNIRNFLITLEGISIALVQFYLPLPVVHMISCSGSIFIALIDYIRFGVKLNPSQIMGIIVGFLGLMVVINDDFIMYGLGFAVDSSSDFQNYRTDNIWITTSVALFFVIVTVLWAYGIVQGKLIN